ncbi:unnamed protein product [Cladocopium goreaui]|uniref:Methyltransferase FkbM domain-containing protein n=1 Tax=Cladocopium goreaui TaxID=2562237 RepID=A0A9P1GTU2_9DINO|nr:unnamed protein product [Cladocopium goreaui]
MASRLQTLCSVLLALNIVVIVFRSPFLFCQQLSEPRKKRYFQSCLPQYFLDHLTKEFYNLAVRQRDGLDVFLETYISLWPTDGLVMFDIGAGCYASGSDSDTTLAIKFAKHFGCAKNRFFAFEPQPDVFMKTMQCLNKELFPDRFCVALENAAFSNVTSRSGLWKKKEVMAWDVATYARLHNLAKIDLLKIDTEGHDFTVVQGALSMLRAKEIMVVVMEVSDKMNPDFWGASYRGGKPVFHGKHIAEPNVKSVWQFMLNLNYFGFWLGTKRLVPLSGACWDDRMEICGDPHGYLNSGICWFDIIFILNQGYGAKMINAKLAYLEKISKTLASVDLEIALRRAIRMSFFLKSKRKVDLFLALVGEARGNAADYRAHELEAVKEVLVQSMPFTPCNRVKDAAISLIGFLAACRMAAEYGISQAPPCTFQPCQEICQPKSYETLLLEAGLWKSGSWSKYAHLVIEMKSALKILNSYPEWRIVAPLERLWCRLA